MSSVRISDQRLLLALTLAAFVVRVAARLVHGEAEFMSGGYTLYREIAQTFLSGGGVCVEPGVSCAVRVPAYPLLLAPFLATGGIYPGLVICQAALGASLVWIAWSLGRDLCGRAEGLMSAVATAFNPYAVTHDTALQETVVANALIAFAVWLLLRSRSTEPGSIDIGAGLALSFAVLTTARVALLVPFVLVWVVVANGSTIAVRARRVLLVAVPIVLCLGGWVARNWAVVGAPILTTEAGESLWGANNEWTFDFLPDRSIDLALEQSYESLSAERWRSLRALDGREVEQDRLLARWAWAYIVAHPGQILWRAGRKVWSAASGRLSPSEGRSPLEVTGYALVFMPVHLLAVVGLWRVRRSWREHALVGAVFLAFALTTAVFWAHTSHKSYLDVFLLVYASAGVIGLARALQVHRLRVPS